MKIVANKDRRLALFIQGRIIRHRVITEDGLWDGQMKKIIAPYAEVDEFSYYKRALRNGDAHLYVEPKVIVMEPIEAPRYEQSKRKYKREE